MDAADKAGIFTGGGEGTWVWRGNELLDSNSVHIAHVRSDVLIMGRKRLLIESTPGPRHFTVRATADDGTLYTITQQSFTVSQLAARCDDRPYSLNRVNWWSRWKAGHMTCLTLMKHAQKLATTRSRSTISSSPR